MRVGPDFGERALADVADDVVLRELVRVYEPEGVDRADGDAGAIAAVLHDQLVRGFRAAGVVLEQPEIDEGAVGVVVDRHDLDVASFLVPGVRLANELVHEDALLGIRDVDAGQVRAAAGVDEVIDAEPADVLALDDAEDLVDVADVLGCGGEAQSDADAVLAAVADALEGLLERAHLAAHVVVARLGAVDGDAGVGDADLGHPLGDLLGDEDAVCGEGDADALLRGVFGEVEDVGADEGLAAGHEQSGDLERREVVDHRLRFLGGHLARELLFLGRGVAVDALEIAGLGGVPDHDRTHAVARAVLLRMGALVVAEAVAEELRAAEQFGNADHSCSSRQRHRLLEVHGGLWRGSRGDVTDVTP